MIKEIKKKSLHNSRKYRKKKANNINKSRKYTKKNQNGGSCEISKRDNFEVTTFDHVDTSKFSISKYVNQNIDWGIMPGAPPTDCCIM